MKIRPIFNQYEIIYVHKEVEASPVIKKDDWSYNPCTNKFSSMNHDSYRDIHERYYYNNYYSRHSSRNEKTPKSKYHMDIRCIPGLLNCLKIKQKQRLKPYVFSVSKNNNDYWHYSKKDGENYSKILTQGTPLDYRKFNELLKKEKSIPTKTK